MIGPGLAYKRCWGGSPTNGATKIVATYTCEWCGEEEEVVSFDQGKLTRGPEGWVNIWRPDLGRELVGAFCSPECQELEVATWRQALSDCMEEGRADPEGKWLEVLGEVFERLKAGRPF